MRNVDEDVVVSVKVVEFVHCLFAEFCIFVRTLSSRIVERLGC